MKATELLIEIIQSEELWRSSWVVSFYREKELADFQSNGKRICGGVVLGADYLCSICRIGHLVADAIYEDYISDELVFCYRIS